MKTAQILQELRLARNMSQDEVAKALGIDRTTYVKYEHGGSIKRNLPKLADFFHVSTDYLLGRSNSTDYSRASHETASQTHDARLALYTTDGLHHAVTCTEHETSLVSKYRTLKPEHQKAVDIQIDYFHGIDNTGICDT